MNWFTKNFTEGELAAITAFINEYEMACKAVDVKPTLEGAYETAMKAIKKEGKK